MLHSLKGTLAVPAVHTNCFKKINRLVFGILINFTDRRHGSDVVAEVDAGVKKMEAYVKALELEIAEREKLIDFLHQATLFYESQRGEAKIVSNVSKTSKKIY